MYFNVILAIKLAITSNGKYYVFFYLDECKIRDGCFIQILCGVICNNIFFFLSFISMNFLFFIRLCIQS